ncbi:hypothetical protein IV203_018191 [Nitzschia inconspicua]|uniref:Uncharacterized protein n=1 Tax=Nitzschia inconspicua TaxID=303405 RepID=A0A9K3M1P3_9STRA|nr:hypothetical protein IV203_018191 [Nitzschia inconspicua]
MLHRKAGQGASEIPPISPAADELLPTVASPHRSANSNVAVLKEESKYGKRIQQKQKQIKQLRLALIALVVVAILLVVKTRDLREPEVSEGERWVTKDIDTVSAGGASNPLNDIGVGGGANFRREIDPNEEPDEEWETGSEDEDSGDIDQTSDSGDEEEEKEGDGEQQEEEAAAEEEEQQQEEAEAEAEVENEEAEEDGEVAETEEEEEEGEGGLDLEDNLPVDET